jgi:hypothetical protein
VEERAGVGEDVKVKKMLAICLSQLVKNQKYDVVRL